MNENLEVLKGLNDFFNINGYYSYGFRGGKAPIKKYEPLDEIRNYYIAEPYVTIIWKNGKKTQAIVDCDDKFDKELGFMLAVYKYDCLYIKGYSKTKYKKELSCIKGSKLYDYLFIRFKEFAKLDTTKAQNYLENLKVTEDKKKKK